MWHPEDRLASTTSTRSLPSLSTRRGADPTIRAQPDHSQPESPDRRPRGSYATGSSAAPGAYSPLSTDGLSNPALGGIRSRRGLRREEQKVQLPAAEETMRAGQSRDKPTAPATTAASASLNSPSPSPSLTFNPQLPLRKRALTSAYSSTIETPPVPDPSSSSYSRLYDRPRRSAPNLNLSLSSVPTPSRSSPLSPISTVNKKNRASANSDSVSSPLSPNAPKRSESSRHIAHQAVRPDVKSAMPSTVSYVENSPRAMNGVVKGQEEGSATPSTTDARSRNEDIFLNLARSDSSRRESLGRSELRRSRYGFSNSSLRSPTSQVNEQTPSPDQLRFGSYDSPLHSNNISPSAPYSSIVPAPASAHPLDDSNRPRYPAARSSSRSTVGLPQSRFSRTSPDTSPRSPAINPDRRSSLHDSRGYRYSTLSTIRSSRHPSGEETPERAQADQEKPRHGETESTLSTNAPSTVWDELDDLKSRIRKLELTGKLPPSSHEAMSSAAAERPRTAATTATTWSSSPKHIRKASIPSAESESSAAASLVHPLLQSALSRAKNVLSREVYNALEMTVMDALSLSNILGSGAQSGSVTVVNGHGVSDKKARRKADSVCRNLTELCLALADEQLNTPLHASHDGYPAANQQNGIQGEYSTPSPTFQRGGSHEPEGIPRRRSTTRVSSRLDGRRASFISPGVNNGPDSGHFDTKHTPSPNPDPPSRLSRLSTSSRTRNLQYDDTDSNPSPHIRSVSRAMTDINPPPSSHRALPRPRISHEYKPSYSTVRPPQNQSPASPSQPQQQHQSPQPRTPSLAQSGIPFRRSYMAPSNYTPATSRSSIQAGSRRYGFTSSPTDGSPAGMPQSQTHPPQPTQQQQPQHQQQTPQQSQTRIMTPSSKLATSYTPIPQNRLRTNSLDTRKFGYRPRPMSTVDGSAHTLNDSID